MMKSAYLILYINKDTRQVESARLLRLQPLH